ncbi:MAG: four helix bundle protein [Spirochaetaceae bacterium 4572_59]|nr:MAG: four helix bundle protein [Spirochaetaceae bacterium 4572_59]
MATVRNYRELIVWQKAMDLVELVYQASKQFPKEELYGLTSQVRRSAVSIPSNIAEGQARKSTAEFLNFLSIANGSRAEMETQILLAQRLKYVTSDTAQPILNLSGEVNRLLNGLMNSLK